MIREEFLQLLKTHGIDTDLVCFDNLAGKDDVIYVRKNHYWWEVSYIERGKEYDCIGFPNESEALKYVIHKVLDTGKKKN